jgi:4'-phosphopantetheinyl transferase EntD
MVRSSGAAMPMAARHYCAVAVARREHMQSLGLDVEQDKELAPEMIAMICTPRERARLAHARDAIVYFAAKEAFYKCVDPLLRTFLDFQDVELDRTTAKAGAVARPRSGSPASAQRAPNCSQP